MLLTPATLSPSQQPGPGATPVAHPGAGGVPTTAGAFTRRRQRRRVACVHKAGFGRSEGSGVVRWPERVPAPPLPRRGPFPASCASASQPSSGGTDRGTSEGFEDPAGTRAFGSPSTGQSRRQLQLQPSPLSSEETPRAPQGTPETAVSAEPCVRCVFPTLTN